MAIIYLHCRGAVAIFNPFRPVDQNKSIANNVDPNETARYVVTSRLIRIYIVCHSVQVFWLISLFATMGVSKFKDRIVHCKISGMSNCDCFLYIFAYYCNNGLFESNLISSQFNQHSDNVTKKKKKKKKKKMRSTKLIKSFENSLAIFGLSSAKFEEKEKYYFFFCS